MKPVMRPLIRLSLSVLILYGCCAQSESEKKIEFVDETQFLMDTIVRIVVYDQDKPKTTIQQAIRAAFQDMSEIEHLCSTTLDSSEISQINRQASEEAIIVSESVRRILNAAIHYSQLTNGAFDVTILPVLKLWNFSTVYKKFRKPDSAEITSALPLINYKNIQLAGKQVRLIAPGMAIDVGGIAKGYAIDRAFQKLNELGISDFMIDAGGDLRVQAGPVSKGKRRIWIKHPRAPQQLWGFFKRDTCAVATSGDYERYFFEDSIRYHHILDPQTGYPARKSISVTTVARTAMEADALATAIFVLGPVKGLTLADSLPTVETVILYEENNTINYVVSQGLRQKLVTQRISVHDIQ